MSLCEEMKKATESTDDFNITSDQLGSHFGFYLFSSWISLSCLLCTFCLCFGFSAVLLHLILSSNIHLISQKSIYSLFKMVFWVHPVSRCCSRVFASPALFGPPNYYFHLPPTSVSGLHGGSLFLLLWAAIP